MSVKSVLDSFTATGDQVGSELSTNGRLKDLTLIISADSGGSAGGSADIDLKLPDGTWSTNIFESNGGTQITLSVGGSVVTKLFSAYPSSVALNGIEALCVQAARVHLNLSSVTGTLKTVLTAQDV